jgi:hypothetical protein
LLWNITIRLPIPKLRSGNSQLVRGSEVFFLKFFGNKQKLFPKMSPDWTHILFLMLCILPTTLESVTEIDCSELLMGQYLCPDPNITTHIDPKTQQVCISVPI